MTKTIGGIARSPSHAHSFPKSSDQNFETAVVISIVEKSSNHVFGDDIVLQIPGERVVS